MGVSGLGLEEADRRAFLLVLGVPLWTGAQPAPRAPRISTPTREPSSGELNYDYSLLTHLFRKHEILTGPQRAQACSGTSIWLSRRSFSQLCTGNMPEVYSDPIKYFEV